MVPIEIQRLQELFRKSGKSYDELAKETGIPKSTLQRYITGETGKIPVDRLECIAACLGSTAKAILGWVPDDDESDRIQRISQSLHENPRLGLLFDRSSKMSAADMDVVIGVVDAILKERDGGD